MSDLIMVNSKIADNGDSGGIAFITKDGYGEPVGIVLGGNSSITLFVKESNIQNGFRTKPE